MSKEDLFVVIRFSDSRGFELVLLYEMNLTMFVLQLSSTLFKMPPSHCIFRGLPNTPLNNRGSSYARKTQLQISRKIEKMNDHMCLTFVYLRCPRWNKVSSRRATVLSRDSALSSIHQQGPPISFVLRRKLFKQTPSK